MKKSKFLILIAIVSIFSSCQKDSSTSTSTTTPTPPPIAPSANFTFSGAGVAPSNVTFTNTSTSASSYTWDFGDNGTSNEVNPTHIYSIGGYYSVKLIATGSGGVSTITKGVSISKPINFKIISVKIIALPLTKTNGLSWDVSPNSGPDVTFTIEKVPYNVQYDHPFYTPDVDASSLPLNLILQNASGVSKPVGLPIDDNLFAINIYDFDPPSSIEKVASISFTPKDYITGTGANPYPSTFIISYGKASVEFTVQYE